MARQNFNSFVIEGNLGKDSEVKTVGQQNMQMVSFSIAANMARNGSQQENVVWFQCSMFRNVKAAEMLKKGTRVLINGQLEINQGQDGKQYHGILVNSFEILSGGSNTSNTGHQSQPMNNPAQGNFDPFANI